MNSNVKNVRKDFPSSYQFQIIQERNLLHVPNARVKVQEEFSKDSPQ